MNSSILELICYPFVVGFFIGYCLVIMLYKSYITKSEKTICPICGKETKNQTSCIFRRKGKIYHVHYGDCANIFLYGEEFYGKRFGDAILK